MKNRATIPAPQNIKRREAYLLKNADTLPKIYVQAQLLKIAKERAEKKLRWDVPDTRLKTQDERMEETKKTFEPIKPKKSFIERLRERLK
jgi:hypothetical protein